MTTDSRRRSEASPAPASTSQRPSARLAHLRDRPHPQRGLAQAATAGARAADGRERGPIADALAQDLGRKPFEAWLADIASTAGEAKDAAKNVGKWIRRKYRLLEMSQLPGRGWVEYEPYGTVLIIGAWNFPFALTLGPAVGAIAAGNTVVLKPSEVARRRRR